MPSTIFTTGFKLNSSNCDGNCGAYRTRFQSVLHLLMGITASRVSDRKRNKLSKPRLGGNGRGKPEILSAKGEPSKFSLKRRNTISGAVNKARRSFSFRKTFSHAHVPTVAAIPEYGENALYEEGRLESPSPVRTYTLHNPDSPRISRRMTLPTPRHSQIFETMELPLDPVPDLSISARRRSQLMAPMPAIATRRAMSGTYQTQSMYESIPVLELDFVPQERVSTPSAYSVIGAFKRGSLRIVNGAASPCPSTTTGAPSVRTIRDQSPSVASIRPASAFEPTPSDAYHTPIPKLPMDDSSSVASGGYFSIITVPQQKNTLRRSRSLDSVVTARETRSSSPFSFVESPKVEPVAFSKISAVDDALFDNPASESGHSDGEEDCLEEDCDEGVDIRHASTIAEDGDSRVQSLQAPVSMYLRLANPVTEAYHEQIAPSPSGRQFIHASRLGNTPSPVLTPVRSVSSASAHASTAYHESVANEIRDKVIKLSANHPTASSSPEPLSRISSTKDYHKVLAETTSSSINTLKSKKGSDSGYSTTSSTGSIIKVKRRSRPLPVAVQPGSPKPTVDLPAPHSTPTLETSLAKLSLDTTNATSECQNSSASAISPSSLNPQDISHSPVSPVTPASRRKERHVLGRHTHAPAHDKRESQGNLRMPVTNKRSVSYLDKSLPALPKEAGGNAVTMKEKEKPKVFPNYTGASFYLRFARKNDVIVS